MLGDLGRSVMGWGFRRRGVGGTRGRVADEGWRTGLRGRGESRTRSKMRRKLGASMAGSADVAGIVEASGQAALGWTPPASLPDLRCNLLPPWDQCA